MPETSQIITNLLARFQNLILFFFFNDTATTEIYTLSLHDALPICPHDVVHGRRHRDRRLGRETQRRQQVIRLPRGDRKSTRLNSSHLVISYAVFCLKKKKSIQKIERNSSKLHDRVRSSHLPKASRS